MNISLSSEYALLALIQIARNSDDEIPSLEGLAISQHLPVEPLAETLLALVRGKYLRNTKGVYRLAKPANKISVAEIIRLFDGALALFEPVGQKIYKPAPMEAEEKLSALFSQIQDLVVKRLESTTLADLK